LGLAKTSGEFTMKERALTKGALKVRPKQKAVIQIKSRPWTWKDREYWEQFGISKQTLDMYHVKPISFYWINGQRYTADTFAYAYCEYGNRIKIYQPLSNIEKKWFSNVRTQDIQGLYQLPIMGSRVVLTSSLKDVMTLSELNIPAAALQSEMMMPSSKLIDLLKRKFDKVEVLYDNDFNNPDNPGQRMAKEICKEFGLTNIVIPEHYQAKDPSDLVFIHGPWTAYNVFK
jgi:hypothetical protein